MAAGAILVFLPSWQAISDVYSALSNDPSVFERCITYVLHSSLPMSEQQEVFQHAPTGVYLGRPALQLTGAAAGFSINTGVVLLQIETTLEK